MHAHDFPRPMADDWRNHAACLPHPTDLFYPPKGGWAAVMVAQAKAICARCEVRDECLEDAMRPPMEKIGIRGGLTGDERRNLRRRRQYASKAAT